MAKKKKKAPSKAKKKRITVSFTWSGLFSTAVLIVLSIIWAFILGILVGRGYSPESLFPKLAGLLPAAESTDTASPGTAEEEEVLKPEELGFFETLQQDGRRPGQGAEQDDPSSQSGRAVEKAPGSKSTNAPAGSEVGQPEPEYRYVYQVASFQSADKAYALQDRLRAGGVSSEVSTVSIDERQWYRIVVPFEGRPQETGGFKAELKRFGLHQPLLRSKQRLGGQ